MGAISIRRIILDNISSTDESEVRYIIKIVYNKYNIPINDHIENIIKDITKGFNMSENKFDVN